MNGTLGWQLVGVVVGQVQSRHVFGRKDTVTAHGYRTSCETCQILVHVGNNTRMTVSQGYLSQCDGRIYSSSRPVVTVPTLNSDLHTLELEMRMEH